MKSTYIFIDCGFFNNEEGRDVILRIFNWVTFSWKNQTQIIIPNKENKCGLSFFPTQIYLNNLGLAQENTKDWFKFITVVIQ